MGIRIRKIFLPYIEDNPKNKDDFAQFVLKACIMIEQRDVFYIKKIFNLFLLWLMKFGIKRYFEFFDYNQEISKKSWLYFEMLELLFTESDLCQNYGINPHKDKDLLLIHLCSRFVIGKESQANRDFLTNINPNYSQMETALKNLQYSKFYNFFTIPFFLATLYEFFQETLSYLLNSKGLIVEAQNSLEIPPNTEKSIEIVIGNRTDCILKNVEFRADLQPPNRINFQKIDPPRLQAFSGDLDLTTYIKSADKTGKCKLILKISFEDPFNPKRREILVIKTFNIRVNP